MTLVTGRMLGYIASNRPNLDELRHRVKHLVQGQSDQAVDKILVKTRGDVDLAATAISMHPRPAWVQAVLGPHPVPDFAPADPIT